MSQAPRRRRARRQAKRGLRAPAAGVPPARQAAVFVCVLLAVLLVACLAAPAAAQAPPPEEAGAASEEAAPPTSTVPVEDLAAERIRYIPLPWLLLLAFICSVPGGFFEMYFRAEQAERALYQIRLVSAVFGVLLPPLLLGLWGPLGVPAGRAGANLVYTVAGFTLYRREKQ